MLTKKLQLLGDFVPQAQAPYQGPALPLDSAEGLLSPRLSAMSPNHGEWREIDASE